MAPPLYQNFQKIECKKISEAEEQYRIKFKCQTDAKDYALVCTVCRNKLEKDEIYSHPVLQVILCTNCYDNLCKTDLVLSNLCCWCGLPTSDITCNKCSYKFCKKCLDYNLGEQEVQSIIKSSGWVCVVCIPTSLWKHRAKCAHAINSRMNNEDIILACKRKILQKNERPLKRLRRSNSVDSIISQAAQEDFEKVQYEQSTLMYDTIKNEIIKMSKMTMKLCLTIKEREIEFLNEFKTSPANSETCERGKIFQEQLITSSMKYFESWKKDVGSLSNMIKFDQILQNKTNSDKKKSVLSLKKIDNGKNVDDKLLEVSSESSKILTQGTIEDADLSSPLTTENVQDDDFNGSIFSQTTEIIDHDEINFNTEAFLSDNEPDKDQTIFCEKTGCFLDKSHTDVNDVKLEKSSDPPLQEKGTQNKSDNEMNADDSNSALGNVFNGVNSQSDSSESKSDGGDKGTICEQQPFDSIGNGQVEFMQNLNLCKTTTKTECQTVNEALAMLREPDDDLFDLEVNSISSADSEEEEEPYVETPKFTNTNEGTVVCKMPVLIDGGDDKVKEKQHNVKKSNPEFNEDELIKLHNINPCYVVLKKLDEKFDLALQKLKDQMMLDNELKEIERLADLKNLEKKSSLSRASPKKSLVNRKKRRTPEPNDKVSSDSEISGSDGDCSVSLVHSPSPTPPSNISIISPEDMLNAIINCPGMSSDFSGKESDSDDETRKSNNKKKKKKRVTSTGSNKENEPTVKNEPISREVLEKGKWKNDPLLHGRLSDSNSDVDVEGDSILPTKLKEKLENRENKRKNRNATESDNSLSLEQNTETEEISNNDHNIDGIARDYKNHIVINSTDTSDSDIEFISEDKKKKLMKLPIIKNSYSLADEDFDDYDVNENDSFDSTKKKGRRNIRAILSDETLEEATKEANIMEKRRKDRLSQKHKHMEIILSQTSQENGLIIEADMDTKMPIIVVNPILTKRLKPHQKQGVCFMWESCYESVKRFQEGDPGSGCILAHCMGLGKTFQVVTFVHTLFSHKITKTKYVLIVCPLSIVLNWVNEFKIGLGNLNDGVDIKVKCLSEHGTNFQRRLFIVDQWRLHTGVLILGYEAYERLTKFKDPDRLTNQELNIRKVLVDPGPDLVVLDEGHLLKNGKNVRTKALMKVRTKRRIILTGTPLQNNLKEYYFMVNFVKPNLLGSYFEYSNRFVNPITNGQYDDSTEADIMDMKKRSHVLHKLLKGTVQRCEVSVLQSYLKEKLDYVLFIKLHPVQIKLYEKYIELLKTDNNQLKGRLFNHFRKLQNIWTHPYLFYLRDQRKKQHKKTAKEVDIINLDPEVPEVDELPDDWWYYHCPEDYKTNIEYGSKFTVLISIIEECEKIGDRMLIFSSSLPELDATEYFLQQKLQWKYKENYYRMDGSVPPEIRLQLCNSFNSANNENIKAFLISHKVGGLGLNLAAANRVILMDISWNPAYDSQSIFRAYRFGQEKQVYVYRFVSLGTMEEMVYERQVTKLAIARRVVDEKQISRHYKSIDLQDMYRGSFDQYKERPITSVPSDHVLAKVLYSNKNIYKYHEHQTLLENLPHEELNEDEMRLAWDEFNTENELKNRLQEQKKKLAAMPPISDTAQPGPSGINSFFTNNTNVRLENNPTAATTNFPLKKSGSTKGAPKMKPARVSAQFSAVNHNDIPVAPHRFETVFVSEVNEQNHTAVGQPPVYSIQSANVPNLNPDSTQKQRPWKEFPIKILTPSKNLTASSTVTTKQSNIVNPTNVSTFMPVQDSFPRIVEVSGGVTLPKTSSVVNLNPNNIRLTQKQNSNIENLSQQDALVSIAAEQQKIISSLHKNLDVTLVPIGSDKSSKRFQAPSLISDDVIQID